QSVDYRTAHFFDVDFPDRWQGNPSFQRFVTLLNNPPAVLEKYLSIAERVRIMNATPHSDVPYLLYFPRERQLSLVAFDIDAKIEFVGVQSGGKEDWAQVFATTNEQVAALERNVGNVLLCTAEGDRIRLDTDKYKWDLRIDKVWNPISRRMA